MKVLVTGAAGFIGHHVVAILLDNAHEVVGLDRIDETSTLARLPQGHDRFKFVWHDLRAPLNELVSNMIGGVDAICHLAASTHVERSIRHSMSFVMDNVVGTGHLLEYAKTQQLKMFLNFSTDEVFGPAPEGVAYDDDAGFDARNPYSATKAAAEELSHAYANTYGIPVLTTHCMNAFGERQHPEKFVPFVIRSVMDDREVPIHVSPKGEPGSRFYIDVKDIGRIICSLVEGVVGEFELQQPLILPAKLNIPGVVEMDNLAMAEAIAHHVGRPLRYRLEDFHSTRPGHDLRYALAGEKLKHLGLANYTIFEESLERTVHWYMDHKEWLL
jgi:dTDP-glucose 4,6-dehydratase